MAEAFPGHFFFPLLFHEHQLLANHVLNFLPLDSHTLLHGSGNLSRLANPLSYNTR